MPTKCIQIQTQKKKFNSLSKKFDQNPFDMIAWTKHENETEIEFQCICSMNSAVMNKLKAKLQTEMLVGFIEWFANKYSGFFGLFHILDVQPFQIQNPKHTPYKYIVQHIYSLYQLPTQQNG